MLLPDEGHVNQGVWGEGHSPLSAGKSTYSGQLAVGDFNHDGAPDLALSLFSPGEAAVLINTQ